MTTTFDGESSERWESGTVVDWTSRGFGFVRPDGGQVMGRDLFVHWRQVPREPRELTKGERIRYVARKDDQGRLQAYDVVILEPRSEQ